MEGLGVSVHWLKNGFMQEVKDAGLDKEASIYDIENLQSDTNGAIRSKGENVRCPLDGRPGASYVHSLMLDEESIGKDDRDPRNVGPATVMLSYSWAYSIGSIVETLWEYCQSQSFDPKQTYVWICALNNNQHRVVENLRAEKTVPFEEFRQVFHKHIVDTGCVLAMMTPWEESLYLKRIWCVFELFTAATTSGVDVTVVIPPDQKQRMVASIGAEGHTAIARVYEVLGNTRAEDAQASYDDDKNSISRLIDDGPGFRTLNLEINDLLRDWIRRAMISAVGEVRENNTIQADRLSNLGRFFLKNGENLDALQCQRKALAIKEAKLGVHCLSTASSHNSIGTVLFEMGDYEGALHHFKECVQTQESILGNRDPDIAATNNNIGLVLHSMGDYNSAFEHFQKSILVQENSPCQNSLQAAATYNNIGLACQNQGNYKTALAYYRKCLSMHQHKLRLDSPDLATTYGNIGCVMQETRDFDGAMIYYRKCLTTQEVLFGRDHPSTAASLHNIGSVMYDEGHYDGAMEYFRECLTIREATLGKEHVDVATSYGCIGLVYFARGDYCEARKYHQRCLAIREGTFDKNNPCMALSYTNIGLIFQKTGEHEAALEHFMKALQIRRISLGDNHWQTANSYDNLGALHIDMENYDAAMEAYQTGLAIYELVLGPQHPDRAS